MRLISPVRLSLSRVVCTVDCEFVRTVGCDRFETVVRCIGFSLFLYKLSPIRLMLLLYSFRTLAHILLSASNPLFDHAKLQLLRRLLTFRNPIDNKLK